MGKTGVRTFFSLLLSDERIVFPTIYGWMNRHNRPSETNPLLISYPEIPRNRKASYTQTKANPSDIPDNRMLSTPRSK